MNDIKELQNLADQLGSAARSIEFFAYDLEPGYSYNDLDGLFLARSDAENAVGLLYELLTKMSEGDE